VAAALSELFGSQGAVGPWQMCARAMAVFVLTLVAMRIAGRRSFGLRTPFDQVVAILLGAVASRAIVGVSSFPGTMGACLTIVLLHRIVGWLSVRWPALDTLLNGTERELARNGVLDREQMRKGLISDHDIEESARQHGQTSADTAERIVLERSGRISVVEADRRP
jgi:uncharacterized membrane protein YcaP (DUF421 family)